MSTQPKTIDDISRTKTVIDGTERVPGRDSLGDFKITMTNLIQSLQSLYVGQEIKYLNCYKPISAEFPWYCLSNADATLTTVNFDAAFITEMRSRKVIYDELNTAVSAFSGSWSGSDFTLDNNAANVAMIAELYEDWLFAGSPTSGWRILVSGSTEYNITNIVTSTRKITVSGSPSGTSIEIYLNRILGSTTSCKHFSEAGLATYQAGGGKIKGLLRRDKMQNITGELTDAYDGYGFTALDTGTVSGAFFKSTTQNQRVAGAAGNGCSIGFDASLVARTGLETQAKSGTDYKYIFVGTYTE